MITGIILILAGMWFGVYVMEIVQKLWIRKRKQALLVKLRSVREMNWAHCRDELDAAIEYIEEHT